MRILFACLAMLCLTACATTRGPDANYQSYVIAHQAAAAQHDAQLATIASAASSCPKDDGGACVTAVAGFAALAAAIGGGKNAALEQYRREPSAAERIGLALVGQLGPLAGAAVNWHQADTARDTAAAQYSYLDHVLTGAVTGIRDVGVAAQESAPRITVGGNYGTTYGNDYTGGDRTQIGGDVTGGDHVAGDGNATRGGQVGDTVGGDQAGRDIVRDSGNCIAGNAGDAGNAAPGGDATAGGDGSDAAGGNGAPGGNGGPGGNCSGGN